MYTSAKYVVYSVYLYIELCSCFYNLEPYPPAHENGRDNH